MSRSLLALLILLQAATVPSTPPQAPGNASPQRPGNVSPQVPGNVSPQAPGNISPTLPIVPVDPAAATFTSEAGLLVVSVKPDKTVDYEDAIRALQESLSKAADERHREIAKGWRVFKSADLDAKANVVYVHVIQPAVKDVDYRPSLMLDELLGGASAEFLGKYRDAIAVPPNKLGLTEFANMSVAPLPKPTNATPGKPTNATPGKPTNATPPTPKKPVA